MHLRIGGLYDWYVVDGCFGQPEGSAAEWRTIIELMRKGESGTGGDRVGVDIQDDGAAHLFSPRNQTSERDSVRIPAGEIKGWIEAAEQLLAPDNVIHYLKEDGLFLISAERDRQVTEEGWTPEHDDRHKNGELAAAAACYALSGSGQLESDAGKAPVVVDLEEQNPIWPWAPQWWKPSTRLRDLVKAGALIAAEIDRLQRKEEGKKSLAEQALAAMKERRDLIASGYAGVTSTGGIVDRRKVPEAIPIPENSLMGVPEPKEVPQ